MTSTNQLTRQPSMRGSARPEGAGSPVPPTKAPAQTSTRDVFTGAARNASWAAGTFLTAFALHIVPASGPRSSS